MGKTAGWELKAPQIIRGLDGGLGGEGQPKGNFTFQMGVYGERSITPSSYLSQLLTIHSSNKPTPIAGTFCLTERQGFSHATAAGNQGELLYVSYSMSK